VFFCFLLFGSTANSCCITEFVLVELSDRQMIDFYHFLKNQASHAMDHAFKAKKLARHEPESLIDCAASGTKQLSLTSSSILFQKVS